MASWNSDHLEVFYYVLGWVAFFSWSISFYPQVFLNFRRKRFSLPSISPFICEVFFFNFTVVRITIFRSVVGLNFDFVFLNLTKHSSYLIYNASLFFSSTAQRQYREKFGFNEVFFTPKV